MMIIGCDFHPSGQQVFGIDSASGEIFADGWIAHNGEEVDRFYGGLPAGAVVGVEASGNLLWFERKLQQYGHRLRARGRGQDPPARDAQAEARPAGRGADPRGCCSAISFRICAGCRRWPSAISGSC